MTVLVLGNALSAQGTERLRSHGFTVIQARLIEELDKLKREHVNEIVLRSDSALRAEDLDSFGSLKLILRAGSGMDNLPLASLRARSVTVINNPAPGAAAVAELTLSLIIALARRVPLGHSGLARGVNLKQLCVGEDLRSCYMGIWGAGRIGLASWDVLRPHVGCITFADWHSVPTGVPVASPSELIKFADIHLIALPLRASTEGMFGERFFDEVSPRRPHVVNVARLGLMDVLAAVRALERDHIRGLAIDPIDSGYEAPAPSMPLNLIFTPHIGAQRSDVRQLLDEWVFDTIVARRGDGYD